MSGLETIVITGGAGFLGSHLSERLLAEGCSVICLDNFYTGTPANVAHLIENPAFRLMRYDVTEYLYVGGAVDAVLHFASPASPVDYLELAIETLKVGSIGTIHALGLAREKGRAVPAGFHLGGVRRLLRYNEVGTVQAVLKRVLDVSFPCQVEVVIVNAVGALAWLVLARLLRRTPTQGTAVKIFDRHFVPLLARLERRRQPPFGQSVLAVATRRAE
jgi:NAD(P)-dependent dehydrogenase (short-subunit alcohol dehydrogenase family)